MTNKEHFANSLDRLINPFIDMILDGDAVPNTSESDQLSSHHWDSDIGHLAVEWQTDKQEKDSCTTVRWNETLVYNRVNSHTAVIRPGEWVHALYRKACEQRETRENSDLNHAIERAIQRNANLERIDFAT